MPTMATIKPIQTEKKCARCKVVKTATEFSFRGDQRHRLRSECISCKNESTQEYKQRNRDAIRKASAEYRQRLANEINERQRLWRMANPESYAAIHSKWKADNKDAVNASTHRRRARIKGNGGSYTSQEWQAIKAAQNYQCLMCKRSEPEIKLTVDHIIPISEGGPNVADNIQGLCKSCNSKKHRKVIDLR